jgi:hypothetical protein
MNPHASRNLLIAAGGWLVVGAVLLGLRAYHPGLLIPAKQSNIGASGFLIASVLVRRRQLS